MCYLHEMKVFSLMISLLKNRAKIMIPILDCSHDVESKSKEIFQAIENNGFVHLINFEFDYEQVEKIFELGKNFWSLNDDQKAKFAKDRSSIGGYVGEGVEKLDPTSQRNELREAFNFCLQDEICINVDQAVPNFYENLASFYQYCYKLSLTILSILGRYLSMEDADFFTKCHPEYGTATTLRLLHYPPVPGHILDSNSTRCGEHSDYGSLTLLFQDMVGGLEVIDKSGRFIKVEPVEKSVLINTGDLLQRWTSDRIKAVKHRVRLPENHDHWSVERYSIAFFAHPMDDCVIECLDGSKTYPPVTAGRYLLDKYAQTY